MSLFIDRKLPACCFVLSCVVLGGGKTAASMSFRAFSSPYGRWLDSFWYGSVHASQIWLIRMAYSI